MTPHPAARQMCLLRHAATPWNRCGRFLGRGDLGVDEAGLAELAPAADVLARFAPATVVSSPALRARQTVAELERLGAVADTQVRVDPTARELDFGVFEGRTRAEIERGPHAGAFARWLRPEFGSPPAPSGETFTSAAHRARTLLERLPPGRTLIVSHGYLLKILLAACVNGEDAADVREVHLANADPIFLHGDPATGWRRAPEP